MSTERYTTKQVIDALQRAKGMVSLAAKNLKCDPSTIRNYIKRYPSVAEAMKEVREATTDIAELSLYRAIQEGQAWAVSLYLRTVGRDRGYGERTDHYHHMVRDAIKQIAEERGLSFEAVEDELRRILPGVRV
jgi:hypothetical protein